MRDIAKVANVHYSTVSLALRNHPRVSAKVKEQIKAIAEEMGYKPDPALSALNAYRNVKLPVHYKSTIAWVDTWCNEFYLRDQPTFNDYYVGACDRAQQLGYNVEDFSLRELGVTPKRLSSILKSRGITGLLLPPIETPGMPLQLDYDHFSTLTFGYSVTPHIFHLVTNHQFHSVNLALEKVTQLGYRRIGLFLHEFIDSKTDNGYTTGCWRFQKRHPNQSINAYLVPEGSDIREGFMEWFEKTRPDVIISDTDGPNLEELQKIGQRVPEDIGCAWLSLGQNDELRSGVDQKGYTIGQTAVDFMVGMLQRGERGIPKTPIRILVEGTWCPGKTLRAQS